MEARLRQALARAEEVARALADPETARHPAKLKQLGREHARLDAIRQAHSRLERFQGELAQAREVLQDKDPELSQLARADVERLRPEIERAEALLADLLTPPTRSTTVMPSWRSAPALAATRRRSSRRTCSACTRATASAAGGRSRCWRSRR